MSFRSPVLASVAIAAAAMPLTGQAQRASVAWEEIPVPAQEILAGYVPGAQSSAELIAETIGPVTLYHASREIDGLDRAASCYASGELIEAAEERVPTDVSDMIIQIAMEFYGTEHLDRAERLTRPEGILYRLVVTPPSDDPRPVVFHADHRSGQVTPEAFVPEGVSPELLAALASAESTVGAASPEAGSGN